MNAEQLLFEHYDGVVDSPDAVSKLRKFILDLAVRGRLVEQDPDDEPATKLLKRIRAEKTQLIKRVKVSKYTAVEIDKDFSLNYSVPTGWIWTNIAKLGLINPRNEVKDSLKASFVSMPMIYAEYGVANIHEPRLWGTIKKGYTHFAEGDVGLAKITPCFENGKSTVFRNLTGRIGSGTTELFILRPVFVVANYVLIFLKCRQFIESGILKMTGTAGQKRVPVGYFATAPFPLPPLAEQHRIVAKVDELMEQCDQLEEKFQERDNHRMRFTKASFASLTESGLDSGEFRIRSGFVLENFDRFAINVDHIKSLRRTILELAVRGKLVEQDPMDEPASKLLERVMQRGRQLNSGGRSRKTQSGSDITPDQLPHELPSNWQWARFGDIVDFSAGKTPPRNETSFWNSGDYPWVSISDMEDGQTLTKTIETVSKQARDSIFKSEPSMPGTIILSFKLTIGKISRLGIPAYHNEAIISIRPHLLELDPYIFMILPDCARSGKSIDAVKGATLNRKSISNILFPLPPLAEQHRIVKKVDELMALCDQLESVVSKAKNHSFTSY